MQLQDMLKLEAASKFGLPAYFAGKIVLGDYRNASRTLKVLNEERRRKAETLNPQDWQEWKREEKALKNQTKLEALLQVSQAREQGQISKRNIMKMDEKVNQKVKKAISKTLLGTQQQSSLSLAEKIEIQSMGDPKQRNLPKIDFEKLKTKKMPTERETLDREGRQDQ